MLSKLFLGMSLVGAEWVLYLLILLSVLSVALMIERYFFYRKAGKDLGTFRSRIRTAAASGKWDEATQIALERSRRQGLTPDMEAEMIAAVLTTVHAAGSSKPSTKALTETAQDAVLRAKLKWDQNLAILATIGSNAPFIGLFGTVLGIIKAFHHLSEQGGGAGVQTVTAGISEALIATAVGILVAMPAVIAYNMYQRKVKAAMTEAEALKSYLVGRLAE